MSHIRTGHRHRFAKVLACPTLTAAERGGPMTRLHDILLFSCMAAFTAGIMLAIAHLL
jgi:hypothetical protein